MCVVDSTCLLAANARAGVLYQHCLSQHAGTGCMRYSCSAPYAMTCSTEQPGLLRLECMNLQVKLLLAGKPPRPAECARGSGGKKCKAETYL